MVSRLSRGRRWGGWTRWSRGVGAREAPGATAVHPPLPRTGREAHLALSIALTGDRRPLHCSREFAQSLGFKREVVHDLLVFHLVFGRAVPDVSLNSPANLGYADVG